MKNALVGVLNLAMYTNLHMTSFTPVTLVVLHLLKLSHTCMLFVVLSCCISGNHCGETFVHDTTEHGIGRFSATPIRDVYHHISDCTWTIVSAIELYAWNLKQLYITEMSIGLSEICEMAYLEVYEQRHGKTVFCIFENKSQKSCTETLQLISVCVLAT